MQIIFGIALIILVVIFSGYVYTGLIFGLIFGIIGSFFFKDLGIAACALLGILIGIGTAREKIKKDEQMKSQTSCTDTLSDYFAALGVTPSATPDDVCAAYRSKINEYHPERLATMDAKTKAKADKEAGKINHAYSMLKAAGLAS